MQASALFDVIDVLELAGDVARPIIDFSPVAVITRCGPGNFQEQLSERARPIARERTGEMTIFSNTKCRRNGHAGVAGAEEPSRQGRERVVEAARKLAELGWERLLSNVAAEHDRLIWPQALDLLEGANHRGKAGFHQPIGDLSCNFDGGSRRPNVSNEHGHDETAQALSFAATRFSTEERSRRLRMASIPRWPMIPSSTSSQRCSVHSSCALCSCNKQRRSSIAR